MTGSSGRTAAQSGKELVSSRSLMRFTPFPFTLCLKVVGVLFGGVERSFVSLFDWALQFVFLFLLSYVWPTGLVDSLKP